MKQNIKRYITILFYTLLGVGLIVVTYLVVADARGYEYDLRTGEININGLLLLESSPTDAQIYIDDKRVGNNTGARIDLTAETHQIRLEKQGYDSWEKKVRIRGERVTDMGYPRLFPEQIQTEAIRTVNQNTLLPNYNYRKALLYKSNNPRMYVLDTTRSSLPVLQTIDLTEIEGVTQLSNITQVSWSPDNRYLLVFVKSKNDSVVLYIDTESSEVTNLTEVFALELIDVRFDHRNSDDLWWLDDGELRELDVSSETVSAPILKNVKQFEQYQQGIAYLESGNSSKELSLNVARISNDITPTRVALVKNQRYFMAYRNIDGENMVFLSSPDHPAQIFSINSDDNASPRVRTTNFQTQELVSDYLLSKYIVAKNGNKFFTLDPSTGRSVQFALPYDSIDRLSWLDGAYLGAIADNKAVIFEFDGKNVTEVTTAKQAITRNENFTELYTIDANTLQKSILRLEESGLPF